jgi:hypothetical protein
VLAALLLNATTGNAHTLAGTMISIALNRPGIVTVTIAAEADPMIAKLEALGGVASSMPMTNDERRVRLESLFPVLRAHIDGRLGDKPLDLTLRDVIVDDTAQVEVHVTAPVPQGPHTLTWRCTFIFGAYQLAVATGDEGDVIQWLQGPQASTPVVVEPSRADVEMFTATPAHIRIGYSLAMVALVAYILTRRRLDHGGRWWQSSRYSRWRLECLNVSPDRSLPSFSTKPRRSSISRQFQR